MRSDRIAALPVWPVVVEGPGLMLSLAVFGASWFPLELHAQPDDGVATARIRIEHINANGRFEEHHLRKQPALQVSTVLHDVRTHLQHGHAPAPRLQASR